MPVRMDGGGGAMVAIELSELQQGSRSHLTTTDMLLIRERIEAVM